MVRTRIHGEMLKVGYEIAQPTVARYMAKRPPGSGQTWKPFLHNHASGIGAMNFLVVPTIGFRLLFVLVIRRLERRRLLSVGVTDHPTAAWIAQQITEAFPWGEAPDYLIRDRDAAYGHVVTCQLAAMSIRDHPIAPRSPWQNGYAERLIGSIRRECLDHIVVWARSPCAAPLRPMPTTTRSGHISLWIRMPRIIGRCSALVRSSLSRSSAGCITNTAGRSFWQAQGRSLRCPSPSAYSLCCGPIHRCRKPSRWWPR